MDLIVERADVWAASIKDKPGSLAHVLASLAEAGADLDFVIARRAAEKPGTGVVFVAPLRGDEEVKAASQLGFNVARSIHAVRVDGDNRPGVGAELTQKLADEGINMRGFSAAVIGAKFVIYIGLDSAEDANKTVDILQQT